MMPKTLRVRITIAVAIAAATVLAIGLSRMSGNAAQVQTDPDPINSLPNPYRTVENWAKLPEGRTWGSVPGVAVDRHGNIWMDDRCGANSCADSHLAPILEFSPSGKLMRSFGADLFVFPHGITVDKHDNVWVTDGQGKDGKGQQVFKFSPEGKILMTLGKAGVAGNGPDTFNMPSAVAIAPNGDIFVADGHGGQSNARIVKFNKDGKFLMAWGQKGTAPGDLDIPHALAFDPKGRLFVADRGNNRIQIFDQQGKSLAIWKQFSRPSAIAFDNKGNIYVADSESGSAAKQHGNWKRGIRIGSLKNGSVKYFIPDPVEIATTTSAAEGIAVDARGVIYGAEVGPKDVKKYVMK